MSPETGAALGAATRWAAFLGTLLVTGAAVFRFSLLPGVRRAGGGDLPGAPERAAAVGAAAALVLAAAAPLRLFAQAAGFLEPGEPVTGELVASILGDTAWGRGWTLQFLAASLALTAFFTARVAPRIGWPMSAAAATAVVLAGPLTGHATASERAGDWGYPLDVIHLLGAGAWLGTLGVLVLTGLLAGGREREATGGGGTALRSVRAFSPIALAGGLTAIASGGVLAFLYLDGSVTALWRTEYGAALFRKLIVVSLVLAIGAYNWRVVTPRLERGEGPAILRRSAIAELTLGTVVLALTAVLVSTGMPE